MTADSPESSAFKHFADAVQVDRGINATSRAIKFFQENESVYLEGLNSVCSWQYSPSEVDFAQFVSWAEQKVSHILDLDVDAIIWSDVFNALYL
jgi:hypothetical protein